MTVDVRQKNLQGKLEAVAEAADKFADELKVLVKERIAAADVVFAVWQDDTARLRLHGDQRPTAAARADRHRCDTGRIAFAIAMIVKVS